MNSDRGIDKRFRMLSAITVATAVSALLCFVGCGNEPTGSGADGNGNGQEGLYPRIMVNEPARAAMLQQGTMDDSPVTVKGEACDSLHTITGLSVFGETITVGGDRLCEPFSVDKDCQWGMTVITGSVTDSEGDTGTLAQSFLRSPMYFPTATVPEETARAENALFTQLNQPVFDDDDTSDFDDIATITWWHLDQNDWDVLFPSTISVSPDVDLDGEVDTATYTCTPFPSVTNHKTGYKMYKSGAFSYTAIEVDIGLVNGGIDLSVSMGGANLPVRVDGYVDLGCLGETSGQGDGSVTAERVVTEMSVTISLGSGGVLEVTVTDVDVTVENLEVDLDTGGIPLPNDLLTQIVNEAVAWMTDSIEQAFTDTFNQMLPPLLADVVDVFKYTTSVHFPAPIDVTLLIDTGLDWIDFQSGYCQIGSYVQVMPDTPRQGAPAPPFGAAKREGAPPSFSVDLYAAGTGMKDDFVNQLLWAAWYGGAFDLDDVSPWTVGTDLEEADVTIFSNLPPVMMPGKDQNDVEIGLGDVYVDVSLDLTSVLAEAAASDAEPLHVSAYVSAIVGGSITVDEADYVFELEADPDPEVYVQIVSIDDGTYTALVQFLLVEGLTVASPDILSEIISTLPLPAFDVGSINPELPATVWNLKNVTIDRQGHYHLFAGSLE